MLKYLRILLAGLALQCNALPALANWDLAPSTSGTVVHIFSLNAANQGTTLCAATSVECPTTVPVNSAGAPMFVTGTPGLVTGTGGTFPVTGTFWQTTQPVSAASLPLPTGAATAAGLTTINTTLGTPFQAGGSVGNTGFNALQAGAANAVGNPFFMSPGTGATFPISAASLPLPTGAATQTTLASLLTALGTPFQAGGSIGNTSFIATQATAANLNMTCANCSGSGASGTDQGGFSAGSSVFAPGGGFFQTTPTLNPLTNGLWGTFQVTAQRALFSNLRNASGAEIGTAASPLFASLNATPTLANGNGVVPTQAGAVLSASNPAPSQLSQGGAVLGATNGLYANILQGNAALSASNSLFSKITDGTNTSAVKAASTAAAATDPAVVVAVSPNNVLPIKAASASIASGAVASGAVASGAVAAGALSAGAGVDGWNITEGTKTDTPCTVPTSATSCSMTAVLKAIANLSIGGNSAASATGSAVPANAGYGGINVGGTLRGQTGVNPSGVVYAAQTDVATMGGTAIGSGCVAAMSGLSTTIPATVCPTMATYVINTLAPGSALSAVSSPVVVASDQAAIAIKAASAAFASGSLASGAVVDLTNMSVATGSAPPTKAIYLGANASGATGGLTRGMITCDQHAFVDNTTQLQTIVSGVSGRKTYVCGAIYATAGTATNIGLTSGTGTNCVSTSVAITPVYQLLANDRTGFNSSFWNGLITLTAADNLCVSKSAANSGQIEVWYAII